MTQTDDDIDGVPEMTLSKAVQVLMQEIADVHYELSNKMAELKQDIASVDQKFTKKFDGLSSDFGSLRMEVHMNQATFMKNHDALEKRMVVMENSRL